MPYEITVGAALRARKEFQRALDGAVPTNVLWQFSLFGENDEDYIRKEVERKLYEPKLPNGGDRERRIIERLKKIARLKNFADTALAYRALAFWSKVVPEDRRNAGYYYIRHPLTPAKGKEEYDWINDRLTDAVKNKDWEKKWFYQLLLDGLPEPVADFQIECLYCLKRPDGNISRLVRLRNVVGETTSVVEMDSDAWHAPQKFRKWCLARGNFHWGAGEKQIQDLQRDIGRLAAWRVVNQIVTLGWLPLAERVLPGQVQLDGIWFFGDCARANSVDAEGKPRDEWLKPDASSIYWHRHPDADGEMVEEGYQLSDDGRENPFFQKRPHLHPGTSICDVPLELAPDEFLGFKGLKGAAGRDTDPKKMAATERSLMCAFFHELCDRVRRAVGDEGAYLLVGSFLSFAAAPEMFAEYSFFPGLWVHGQASSGKSTVCELLMGIWGFSLQNGLMLRGRSVSAVGLLQAADQYSNLPVWVDEFRNSEVDPEKLSVLHNGYNRAGQAKFNPSRIQRLMRTNFIVSGESTSNDAAMRSRYPHIQMSKKRRLGTVEEQKENLQWFNTHRKYFYFFGRYVIEHRRQFVATMKRHMESWSREEIDPRLKIVHGIGYASWMAMAELLNSHVADELDQFREHMVEHSSLAAADVESELNINVFMQDVIAAAEAGEIAPDCFRVLSEHANHPPGYPEQLGGWYSYTLLMEPHALISQLAIYLRKAGRTIILQEKDLRDQLSKYEFWLRAEPGKRLNFRMGRAGQMSTKSVWGIKLDYHPLGLQEVTTEEWQESLKNSQEGDPRKGPLFSLVEWVLKRQKAREEGEA